MTTPPTYPREITCQFATHCLSCEEKIAVGERVMFQPGAGGVWHTDCPTPKNLAVHARAAAKRRELGID